MICLCLVGFVSVATLHFRCVARLSVAQDNSLLNVGILIFERVPWKTSAAPSRNEIQCLISLCLSGVKKRVSEHVICVVVERFTNV